MRRSLALGALIVVACGPSPTPRPPPPPPHAAVVPPPEPRADGRLPPLARPTAYELAFDVDPRKERFSGKAIIDVDLPAATPYLVLHGHNLHLTSATVQAPQSEPLAATVTARLAAGAKAPEELVLALGKPVGPGPAKIALAWDAPFGEELSGLYRVKEDDRWYAFTQFESTDARRAFPCFDEPAFKVPFTVSVNAPEGMIAVANAPEASHEGTTFRFARTKPLPTYLVAFAVGELDVREAKRTKPPAIRIVTPKGKAVLGDLALEATGGLVDTLADWFGIPYPYEKLDVVAVPEFAAGAMENAGLVTFRQELLLLDPAHASGRIRRAQALVVAHELAHQWFGNLVTAEWWNDIWLNEGMASWMESRAVDRWRPAWGARIDAADEGLDIMDQDSLATARVVRQPVTTTSEIEEAFDGITYEKGAAVLWTIESWLGEATFQKGVRAYLNESAWKSVHADALLSALDRASGKDVSRMAATFLDRPGVPAVSLSVECERGARFAATISSERWKPLGSIAQDDGRSWIVPVCLLADGKKQPICTELTEGAPRMVSGSGCPAWFHPNASSSYYRFYVDGSDLAKLAAARKHLDVPQRVSLLSNAWASVRSGALEPGALVKNLPAFDEDDARQVVGRISGILGAMSDVLVEDEARPAFKKQVAMRFERRKKAVGWAPKKDELPGGDESILRTSVLWTLAELAEDETTLREAEELATKWLADPTSVDADAATLAVDLASRRAGEARLGELVTAAKNAKTDEHRITALRAMSGFDDPRVLEKALDLLLTDTVKMADVRYVLNGALGRRKVKHVAERWLRAHWDDMRKKLPGSLSAALVRGAGVACTPEELEDARAFYTKRAADIEGAARGLAETLEGASLCAELRAKGSRSLTKALRSFR